MFRISVWWAGLVPFGVLAVVLLALPAGAQSPTAVADEAAVSDFDEEGLGDTDLLIDLENEALPTTEGFQYWWERLQSRVQEVFIFNAERKAVHLRQMLHRLDRKVAACAELGDEECVARVEQHIAQMQERAAAYIAKQQELAGEHLARFEVWRERRAAIHDQLEEVAAERRDRRAELLKERATRRAERQERRSDRREDRQDRREQRQEERSELRSNFAPDGASDLRTRLRDGAALDKQDQRLESAERLIELRSQRVRDQLDATQERVELRRETLDQEVSDAP